MVWEVWDGLGWFEGGLGLVWVVWGGLGVVWVWSGWSGVVWVVWVV